MTKNFTPIMIKVADITPNEWNPNEMSEEEFSMLLDNISRVGFVDPLLVTKDEDYGTYKVVDGEHRYRAALLTGMDKVPAVVVELSEEDQRLQTVRMNQIKGEWNPDKFNKLVNDMMKNQELTIEDAAYELGFANPNDFHLLRDLLRESIPSTKAKKEFDIKAEKASNTEELYSVLNEIMEKLQSPGEGNPLWVKDGKNSKSIWVVTNPTLVRQLIALNTLCSKNKQKIEDFITELLRTELRSE